MTLRTLPRILLSAAAVAGLAVLAACSSAPQEAAQSNDEQLVTCAPPQYRVCYPGEGLGGSTLCGCDRAAPTRYETTSSCGAYGSVPVPSTLDSRCTPGTTINGTMTVWSCPMGVVVPAYVHTPPPGFHEIVQEWIPGAVPDGGSRCDGTLYWSGSCYFPVGSADYCIGQPASNRVLIVTGGFAQNGSVHEGSGCTGLCGLCQP